VLHWHQRKERKKGGWATTTYWTFHPHDARARRVDEVEVEALLVAQDVSAWTSSARRRGGDIA